MKKINEAIKNNSALILLIVGALTVLWLTRLNLTYVINKTVSIVGFTALFTFMVVTVIKRLNKMPFVQKIVRGEDGKQSPMEGAGYMLMLASLIFSMAVITLAILMGSPD